MNCMYGIVWKNSNRFASYRKLKSCSLDDIIQRLNRYPLSNDDFEANNLLSLYLSAILLSSDDVQIQKSVLSILMKTNAGYQLPLILFLLSKTPYPDFQLILTYKLPLTAVDKVSSNFSALCSISNLLRFFFFLQNNISPVLTTLNALTSSNKPVLAQVSIQLYLQLWKIEKRCYPYLSEQIQKHKVVSPDMDWEKDVIVAHAIREICTLE